MIITYYGTQFFRLQVGDVVIATNPTKSTGKGEKGTRFGADVALVSMRHPDYDAVDSVTYGDKIPFTIDGPGSYEVVGIPIDGKLTSSKKGKRDLINSVYFFTFDDISVCFLGHLSSRELPQEVREAVDDIDILFVAVDGEDGLAPHEAYKLAVSLEPHVIIPMQYDAASLATFLKEGDEAKVVPIEKFTIKKKDLISREAEIVVLST